MWKLLLVLSVISLLYSCGYENNYVTGWEYNNPKQGGFQKVPFVDQETAPNLILYQGHDLVVEHPERGIDSMNVPSFYISKYEETNIQYRAYLDYLKKYYSAATYSSALPDTNLWFEVYDTVENFLPRDPEFLSKNYLRNPMFDYFPVVGLTPEQIQRYAQWKTDRMNEYILIREGLLANVAPKDSTEVFQTEQYFKGQYDEESLVKNIEDLNPDNVDAKGKLGRRVVRMEDGVLLPKYRLPTENEWQLARMDLSKMDGKYPNYKESRHHGKLNKDDRFWYLSYMDAIIRKDRKKVIGFAEHAKWIKATEQNKHFVFGLEDNVHEISGDSTGYVIIGHSEEKMLERGAVIWYADDSKNVFYHTIIEAEPLAKTKRKIYGFRLAMDRVGSPPKDY